MSENVLEKQRLAILDPLQSARKAALGMWESLLFIKHPVEKDIGEVIDLLRRADTILERLGREKKVPTPVDEG